MLRVSESWSHCEFARKALHRWLAPLQLRFDSRLRRPILFRRFLDAISFLISAAPPSWSSSLLKSNASYLWLLLRRFRASPYSDTNILWRIYRFQVFYLAWNDYQTVNCRRLLWVLLAIGGSHSNPDDKTFSSSLPLWWYASDRMFRSCRTRCLSSTYLSYQSKLYY